MTEKPTYKELEQRVTKFEKEVIELKESEERYNLIIEQAVNPMACFSLDGHIQMINTAAANNMGGSPNEFIGKTIQEVLPDKAGLTMERIRKIRESGSGFKFEDFFDLPSGNYWYLTDALPIRDKNSEIIAIQVVSSDITEKKLTEQALIKSEEKYRVFFEGSAEGILVADIETKKLKYANPEICRMLGFTEDELIKMDVSDIHPMEVLDHLIPEFEAQRRGEKTLAPNIPFLTKNGNIIYADIKNTKALIDDRECNIGFFTDITERKQAEEALRESEEKYRLLVDNFRDPILLYDRNGINLVMNPAAAINLGGQDSKPEDFIGRSVCDFYPGQAGFVMERNQQVIETEERAEFEDFVILPSGSFWFWSILQPVKDANGDTYAVQIISHDITERKRAEEELRDREEKLRIIFENINEEIVFLDSQGICLDVNKKVEDIFGYKPKEVIGKNLTEIPFCSPDSLENLIERFSKAASGDFNNLIEIEGIRKDGTEIEIEASTNTIKKDGELNNIIVVIRDITDRKQAEEEKARLEIQLLQAKKMEAIGTLAGGVAHDLNNILSGIVGYPDLLLMQLPEDSPLRKPILTIQETGQKAAAIVQDMLTLARRGVAVTEVVNLNAVISDYLQSPEYEKMKSFYPNVEVETNLETDLMNILGSPVHLLKTVMNLVSNAAEAITGKGKITISAENRYVDRPISGHENVEEGDYVVLTVSDTGAGISKEDIRRIFEPFYTKKKMGKSGTGLGMAVIWGTVKDHNGYIDVQSSVGKGTTFTLYVPVTRQELAKDQVGLTIESYKGRGESILVIDDVIEQREIASSMLSELGYSVTTASSGEEAIEYLQENSVDLLLLDMIMDPGMDGLDTYKKILEIHPDQKAIIASGYSETARVKEVEKLGAGQYLRKPYNLEKVGIAVKNELEK